jgi:trehalose-6-phosphate synthase
MVMSEAQQQELLLAQVLAMVTELNARIGVNPYSTIDFSKYDKDGLTVAKRQLHELLYAPPGGERY